VLSSGRVSLIACAIALVGAGRVANAAEVHSLFDLECRRTSGILVHVGGDAVALVGLDGSFVSRQRDQIASVAVHKTLENPLARIALSPELRDHLRDVWVGDDSRPTFTGWTTAFFDDLLLYYDIEGQTHVLDPQEIRRLRSSAVAGPEARPRSHAAIELAFPAEVIPCGTPEVAPGAVLPSRVIADQIKVGDYLRKLEERYRAQAGFEERTRVYAEPFLFGEDSRLGLLYDPEWDLPLPLYFRWSSGRPYRFQSLNVVGNAPHEWLPIVKPTISIRSDIKSHFFHGSFIGHVVALPAGTNPFLLSELDDFEMVSQPDVDHSYNYLLLMGGDFWRLSASIGTSYLAARLRAPGVETRRVLATGLSPTVRLRYQSPALQLRALYFRTRSTAPVSDASFIEETDTPYHWRLDTGRLGATWRPHPTIELLFDQLASRGAYRDAYAPDPLALRLWEFASSAEVAVTFGRYVTVRATGRLYVKRYSLSRPAVMKETSVTPRFGGALEFVF
jgi:hypothetical protein